MVPSSYGEALDRLTILELKKNFIKDKRREDVEREYNDLRARVNDFLVQDTYHYTKLLEVNYIMWMLQEELHSGNLKEADKDKEFLMMKQLAVENQRRFRLKRTLNQLLGSLHKEQKGYAGKSCLVLGHQGMGDHLFLNGAIRFLTTVFDEVCVVVNEKLLENIKILYSNEPSVSFHTIRSDAEFSPNFGGSAEAFQELAKKYSWGFMLGYHGQNGVPDFPLCFYDEMKLERRILKDWSYLPSTKSAEGLPPFVFYHSMSSNFVAQIPVDIESMLVLNPSQNMYPQDHKWHAIAQEWVGLPFFDYTSLLKKAEKLLVVDSSFFCMAVLLNLKPEVWTRNGRSYKTVAPDLVEHKC